MKLRVFVDSSFITYYVSIVPGQNLMRDQVWDISWKLGNTAENGAVVSGGMFVFRPHLYLATYVCGPSNLASLIILPMCNTEGQWPRSFRFNVDLTFVKYRLFVRIQLNS